MELSLQDVAVEAVVAVAAVEVVVAVVQEYEAAAEAVVVVVQECEAAAEAVAVAVHECAAAASEAVVEADHQYAAAVLADRELPSVVTGVPHRAVDVVVTVAPDHVPDTTEVIDAHLRVIANMAVTLLVIANICEPSTAMKTHVYSLSYACS